jgi:hypothetical protein
VRPNETRVLQLEFKPEYLALLLVWDPGEIVGAERTPGGGVRVFIRQRAKLAPLTPAIDAYAEVVEQS